MRLSIFNFRQAKSRPVKTKQVKTNQVKTNKGLIYIALVAIVAIVGLFGIEYSIRKMPSAYCMAKVNLYYGCSHMRSLKKYLGDSSSRIFLGDSHVEFMVDYQGFRDYSMPAMLPTEMLVVMRYLLKQRKIDRVLIGLAAHHMQDKSKTRGLDVFAPGTLTRQFLPFPIYALEPSLTVGLREYLWDTLFGRPLPVVRSRQTITDEEMDQVPQKKRQAQRLAAQSASREGMLWWQREPLVIEEHDWLTTSQENRKNRANKRFRFFYPLESYKETDEHATLLELFEILRKHDVDTCFVRFPHTKEYDAIAKVPEYSRYDEVQTYLQSLVESSGFRYLDTDDLDLQLSTMHFRDSDHLLVPVIDVLTPVITDACFPNLSDTSD